MVFSPDNLRHHLHKYLEVVRQHYQIEKAVLFGSYAHGTPREDSDIDLVIISPDFQGVPKLTRHQKLGWLAWQAQTPYVQPLGFTPEEYANASPLGLLGEVKETGQELTLPAARALRETAATYLPSEIPPMKIIIPLAGFGKRLRPHTFTKPKPLINVAGKPVLGHVLDMFAKLDNVEEVIFIVGHLGEQIDDYVTKEYPHLKAVYYRQEELNGQSTALYLARERLTGPMLMVFVDTIIEADLSVLKDPNVEAMTWVKAVPDPRRFGVAEVGPEGYVTRLIEKPTDVTNNLVMVGFYYFRDGALLMDCIREQIEKDVRTQGEYFLADAVNLLLKRGVKMRVQPVDVWLDCGKTETVLETNRYMLEHGHDNSATHQATGYTIIPPVNIHPTAQIARAVIGPHATIAARCQVEDSIVRDSIVDEGAVIKEAMLTQSLIGSAAKVSGRFRAFNVGEASEVGFE